MKWLERFKKKEEKPGIISEEHLNELEGRLWFILEARKHINVLFRHEQNPHRKQEYFDRQKAYLEKTDPEVNALEIEISLLKKLLKK